MAETPPETPAVDEYIRQRVAPRFRDLVETTRERLAAAQRELDDLLAATGTMLWEVTGPVPARCYVNIGQGAMTVADQALAEPFMTIAQAPDDWARFTAGVAQTGFLSGQTRRPFGRARIERLRPLKGALRFVLTGLADGGSWTFTLYFGSGERPAQPQTTVTLAADLIPKIQSGQIDPQMAFMQGQVKISGDLGLAVQLGTALFM